MIRFVVLLVLVLLAVRLVVGAVRSRRSDSSDRDGDGRRS
jgi:hypothetical protein